MNIMRNFAHGIFTVLKLTGAPLLYRYPHRNSAEALRADWLRISADLEAMMAKLKDEAAHERG